MRVGIHQPNYLPWLGYFHKVALCDLFVFLDNVQMPGDTTFVSRNTIKAARGPTRLTVPVSAKGPSVRIADVRIASDRWMRKHIMTIEQAYASAKWLSLFKERLVPILMAGHVHLADLNVALVVAVSEILGIQGVRFVRATELPLQRDVSESIPEILSHVQATHYYTGNGQGSTWRLHADELAANGIETRVVEWKSPEYGQLHGPYLPNLSALDALLNLGPEGAGRLIGTVTRP